MQHIKNASVEFQYLTGDYAEAGHPTSAVLIVQYDGYADGEPIPVLEAVELTSGKNWEQWELGTVNYPENFDDDVDGDFVFISVAPVQSLAAAACYMANAAVKLGLVHAGGVV